MTFLELPWLTFEGRDKWKLRSELVYYSALFDVTLAVPGGFVTDLASIPRGFQWLIPVNGRHRAPAVVHDYLYSEQGQVLANPQETDAHKLRVRNLSRKDCDQIFKEAMKVAGVGWFKRNTMYRAVRIGGWASW